MRQLRLQHILLLLMLAFVLASCNDDDTFSTSRSNLLMFSTDTVRLDTTFSRVPTHTKTFWVYNYSGDGIRCSNIRLASGNQTGFRVNVDGVYLGQASGYQVNDIEVRDKDSIRVFVELTSPMNQSDTPQLVEDDLVFTLESGVEQKVKLNAYSWDALLLQNLDIRKDTTINSKKPVVIQGGIKVEPEATLTIAAGTTLYFANGAGIDVYGRLICAGTADAGVVLRGDRMDRMFDYLPYDRVSGQWQGIHLYESSYGNQFNYLDLHSSFNGIVCDSSDVKREKLQLYNSTVHNCQGYGVKIVNSKVDVWNCQITNTLNDCLAVFGGDVQVRHCTLAQFYPFDSERGASLRFANMLDGIAMPIVNLEVLNSIVTGYADDCLMGMEADSTVNYRFDSDILRTPKVTTKDSVCFHQVRWEDPKDTIAGGEKMFRKIDADRQYYDFHLDSVAQARDAGMLLGVPFSATDRDGKRRDEIPDMGCYEFIK
jgi:hypothetical protein